MNKLNEINATLAAKLGYTPQEMGLSLMLAALTIIFVAMWAIA